MTNDVLLIGVDAGDFRTIDRFVDEGRMPTFESLINDGYDATLESSVPPWTPTAWTSLTSGQNPGKHGIFDFKTPDGERIVNATDVRTNRIWDYLDHHGLRSLVVNVPITHPAPDIDGVLVPGYLGPRVNDVDGQPSGIVKELRNEIGGYRIYKQPSPDGDESQCDQYASLMRMRRDAMRYLNGTYSWDFAMVQFQRTDTVFHEAPSDSNITRIYTLLDQYVGEIVDDLNPDTVVVASDHGMGKMNGWDFRINTWLKQRDLLETSVDGYESGWEVPGTSTDDEGSTVSILPGGGLSTFVRMLSRVGISPQRCERLLSRVGLSKPLQRALPNDLLHSVATAGESIDIENSRAYCPSGPGLGVYCDDEVRDELIDELRSIRLPDSSEHLFEEVVPSEAYYTGPCLVDGPDILAIPEQMNHYVSATLSSDAFVASNYEYNHKRNGIFVAAGPSVDDSPPRGQLSIHDVAPTVLSLLDVPLDTAMDGEAVPEVVDEPSPVKQYESIDTRSQSSDLDGVESRLEELGYL